MSEVPLPEASVPDPQSLRILGLTEDLRSKTRVIYTQMPVEMYLWLVGESFDEFEIQRKRQKHPIYDRMGKDIREGALLPGITLAVKFHNVQDLLDKLPAGSEWPLPEDRKTVLREALLQPGMVNILDGLQRTHKLKDISKSGFDFDPEQRVLAEIWVEPDLAKLIYRIIVLNAGQKPMTLRHQVELLFLTLREQIIQQVPGVELYKETDSTRRRGPNKLAFDRVVSAYQAFVNGDPEVNKSNIIAQELQREELSLLSEDRMLIEYESFLHYLMWYVALDREICRVYPTRDGVIPTGANWFGSENVMVAFFAAAADFGRTKQRKARTQSAIEVLHSQLKDATPEDDVLGMETLRAVVQGFNPRRTNVGKATRGLLFRGFKEYFREEGEKPLEEVWVGEA